MLTIETPNIPVSAGQVRVGDVYYCVESEKRGFQRRTLTVKGITTGTPPTAICASARDGMPTIEVRVALYRLVNPTKFRHIETPRPEAG